MQLFDFEPDEKNKTFTSDADLRMRYDVGEAVHDVAYKASPR